MNHTILTDAEIATLAEHLQGSANVYTAATARFSKDFRDSEDWDRLREAGVFRCDKCSCWKGTEEEDGGGVCCECAEGDGDG